MTTNTITFNYTELLNIMLKNYVTEILQENIHILFQFNIIYCQQETPWKQVPRFQDAKENNDYKKI